MGSKYQKSSRKKQKNAKKLRNLESGQQWKQNKHMPKWQILNQMVVHHFLTNIFEGLIYICRKAQIKKLK